METQLTKLLNLSNPIMVAGMGHITGPDLAAAVSNAGGIGTIGAIPLDPEGLRTCIHDLKAKLNKGPGLSGYMPFGIDYLLPQVGGNARKTNKDYTGGQLANLIDGSTIEIIDNCGHMMLLEESDKVLKVLKKFILTYFPINKN